MIVDASGVVMISIKLKEHVQINLKELHLTNINVDPTNTMFCIINFNCMNLLFTDESLGV